jgi:hypothetical protein
MLGFFESSRTKFPSLDAPAATAEKTPFIDPAASA